MKHTIKNILSFALLLGVIVFSLTSCYESHYYNRNHHHSRGWYDHRHQPYPAGVNFEVEVHH